MTIKLRLWLFAIFLCMPAFSFEFASSLLQAPITYEGITYTQKPDGKWYASDALGESNDASFMNRVLVKLPDQENPWGLTFCTEEEVQLDPSLPVAQGRYIGFGWSLLVYPSEASGIAAANYLAIQRSQEAPMIQFDATVKSLSSGNLDPFFYAQRNLENTFQNCGNPLGAGGGAYPIELAVQDLWQMAAAAEEDPLIAGHQSVIAVIDDSFYMDHLDLQGGFWVNEDEDLDGEDTDGNGFINDIHGFNFADCNGNVNSITGGHGTPILGIIGANSGNDLGIAGIVRAPSGRNYASMMLIKTASAGTGTQEGTLTSYYQGVYYAVTNGADIINASWGFERDYPMPRDIQEIIDATSNVLIVAAVGNFPHDYSDIHFPARYENTLAVTSSNCFGTTDVNAAQKGPRVDVAAPAGVLTLDTSAGDPEEFPCDGTLDCYNTFGATSSAAPHVTGAAAMMLAMNPYLSALNIAFLIRENGIKEGRLENWGIFTEASYEGPENRNDNTGYGLLNAVGSAAAGKNLPAIGNVQWRLMNDDDDRVDRGDEINITWNSLNLDPGERVNIDLLDSLGNPYPMFTNIPADAPGVRWVVPDNLPDNKSYIVKIMLSDDSNVVSFSKYRVRVHEHDWIDITSESSHCDYWEKLLTWETTYPSSSPLLLEVTSGNARGAVFLQNTNSRVLTYNDLDNLLRAQDPENYEPLLYFEIRLVGSPESHVTSEIQGLVYGQLNVQACVPDYPNQ